MRVFRQSVGFMRVRDLSLILTAWVVACLGLVACSRGNVFSLEAGDCFDGGSPGSEVSDVEIVSCEKSHHSEVYAVFDLSGSDWPGQGAVGDMAERGCLSRFKPYVGIDYDSSEYYAVPMVPSSNSWKQGGDREVVCVLQLQYGMKTGSAKGTRR